MPRFTAPLAALALSLVALCTPATAREPEGSLSLTHQGSQRHYLLRLPPGERTADTRLPLVIVLHGGGGHGENAEAMTGFTPKAMKEGFAVAYPDGSGRLSGRLLTWNAGHCCGHALEHKADDVGFIRTLIDTLVAERGIDPKRVYVTGLSNGGMMAHRLGRELPERIAAIAPVIATLFGDEKPPAHPVAMLAINGQLDRSMPIAGGPTGGRFSDAWDGTPTQPGAAQGRFWAAANGCTGPATETRDGPVTRWRYRCPDGRSVEQIVVADNGHAWPGGQPGFRGADPPSQALKATEVIWDFFAAQRR